MDTGETGVNMNVPGVDGACGCKVHDHGQAKKSKFNLKSKHGGSNWRSSYWDGGQKQSHE